MTPSRRRSDGVQGWLHRLLRLYPSAFREQYGDDFVTALDDWRADRGTGGGRLWSTVWVSSWLGWLLIRTCVQEWLAPSARPSCRTLDRQHPRRAKTMDLYFQDLRFALRSLARRPGFVTVAVLTLAIGVGANTSIFSVVNAVLLEPLPYEDPDDLLMIRRIEQDAPGERRSMSQPDIEDLAHSTTLAGIAGFQDTSLTLTGRGEPEVVRAGAVNDGLLSVFGVAPQLGRDLRVADNVPNGPRMVVIGHSFWQTRLGGSPDVIGSLLELDGEAHDIVGVAPEGFEFPEGARLWVPLYNDVEGCGRGCHFLTGIARLAHGHELGDVQEELDVMAARLAQEYPAANAEKTFVAFRLSDGLVGEARRGLLVLLGAVGLVMLIAAANLASLQVARGTSRKREMGVRTVLGASRSRLCRLVLLESGLLGVAGGALGVGLAVVVTRWVLKIAPAGVPGLDETTFDARVLGYGLAISLGASVLFSLLPAWRLASVPSRSLSLRTSDDHLDVRSRNLLLMGEVALSLMLLIGAALLMTTYSRILKIDLGFDKESVLSFFVSLPENGYHSPDRVVSFFDRLEEELAAIPGVESVGGILGRPFGGNTIGTSWHYLDQPVPEEGRGHDARMRIVLPGYLKTLKIPVEQGRGLGDSDRQGVTPVALVNRAFVRRFADLGDPLGREVQLGLDFGFEEKPRTIVGIIGDTQTESLTGEPRPEVFIPQSQMASIWMSVVLRAQSDGLWPQISEAVHRVDPLVPLRTKETLSAAVDRARGPARFYFVLLSSFAGIAVMLSSVGLYGVVSYLVARRTRELAIRLAVGASSWSVVHLVLREGLRPVLGGVMIGLSAAFFGARLLGSLLYEVEPHDPKIYLAVTLLLLLVSVIALIGPAGRAARLAPARALTEE